MDSGQFGEEYTAWRLQKKGAEILYRNWQCRYGEVDIIARYENFLLFVEVKTRKHDGLTDPLESITRGKQRRVIRTAQVFLQQKPEYRPLQPRFDAAAVYLGESGKVREFRYLPGAFEA